MVQFFHAEYLNLVGWLLAEHMILMIYLLCKWTRCTHYVSIRAMTDHFMFYSMRCNFLATHNSHVCNFRARAFNANFYIRKLINCTFGIDATSQRSRRDSWENYARTCTFHISHSLQLIIDCIFSGRKQSDFYVCLDAWCLAFILAFLSTS